MKTVGVIGGLGPETTAEFYLELIFGAYEKNKLERPNIIIWNVPIKYKFEEDLLKKSSGEERYIPFLVDAAKNLESAGADFLVMPCNSLHIFIDQIRAAVNIPVLSIVEETASFLHYKKIRSVGILATSTSLKKKLYEKSLRAAKITQVVPDGFNQAKIGKMISNIVINRHDNKDRQDLLKIIDDFKKVDAVILACTDLQLLIPANSRFVIYDTMKIFAEATVSRLLE